MASPKGKRKRPAPDPWTERDQARLVELHAEGQSCNAIARAMGRSASTIGRHARESGLSFARERTVAATGARVADARAQRAEQALGLIEDARRLRARMWEAHELHSFGGSEHTHRMVVLDQPPPADQRSLMSAASTALVTSMRLDDHDDDNGASAAMSMMGNLYARLVESAGPYPGPDDGLPSGE